MKYTSFQYASVLHDLMADAPAAKRREIIREFLDAAAKNNALSLLPEITREFEALSDKKAGLHHVVISTPERLPEGGVARKLGLKAKVTALRDVRLGGGAVVQMDDVQVDNSVANRMRRARAALTGKP